MTQRWPAGAPSKAQLRALLLAALPWLAESDVGPASVVAGACDRCGAEPRLVGVCGPGAWEALGRTCALEVGADAWCEGHADDADRALTWLAGLPPEADDAAWLWWLSTGEVRPDAAVAQRLTRLSLSEHGRAALGQASPDEASTDEASSGQARVE